MRRASVFLLVTGFAMILCACDSGDGGPGPTQTGSTPAPDFQITCGASTLSAGRGCASSTCTVTSTNGFTGTVALRFAGLPPGIRVDGGDGSVPVSADGSTLFGLTVSVAPGTEPGTYPLEVSGSSGSLVRSFQIDIGWNGANVPEVDPGRGPMTLTGCAGYRAGVLGPATPQRFSSVFVGAWSKTWRGDFCAQTLSEDDGFFTFLVPRRCFRQGQRVYLTAGGKHTCVAVPYGSGQHAHVTLLGGEAGTCE